MQENSYQDEILVDEPDSVADEGILNSPASRITDESMEEDTVKDFMSDLFFDILDFISDHLKQFPSLPDELGCNLSNGYECCEVIADGR